MLIFIKIVTVKDFFRISIEDCLTMSVRYLAGTENVQLVSEGSDTVGGLFYTYVSCINALCLVRYCTFRTVLLQMVVCIALCIALHAAYAHRVKGWCHVGSMGKCKTEFD
jgi:hypothetical protein